MNNLPLESEEAAKLWLSSLLRSCIFNAQIIQQLHLRCCTTVDVISRSQQVLICRAVMVLTYFMWFKAMRSGTPYVQREKQEKPLFKGPFQCPSLGLDPFHYERIIWIVASHSEPFSSWTFTHHRAMPLQLPTWNTWVTFLFWADSWVCVPKPEFRVYFTCLLP